MTTVLLVFIANPYLALLQKRTYLKYWKSEVDEVLINVNGHNDQIRNFIAELWQDDKVKFIDNVSEEMRQGEAFNRLYPHATGDIIMTLDSDNFIYKTGVIKKFVEQMSKVDSIGSRGLHAFPYTIAKRCIEKYGIVRLNPFLGFYKKKYIDKIKGLDFRTRAYKAGQELDFFGTMPCDGWFDVMSEFAQRYFKEAPKYKLINEIGDGYVHFGGISSLYRRYFRNLEDTNEQKYKSLMDAKQNIAYWINYYLIFEAVKKELPFEDYNKEYERGLFEQIQKTNIGSNDFEKKAADFKSQFNGLFL
jgi:glycosyltransferase involved in cell wall biosynthesis